MVSRDYIKYNKKELRRKKIKGNMLKRFIKTGEGKNERRKLVLVSNVGEKKIRKQEVEEIYNLILKRKTKNKLEYIKKRVPVANRRQKNRMGVELGSKDLLKLKMKFEKDSKFGKHKSVINYLQKLYEKRLKEEISLVQHKKRHKEIIARLNSDRVYKVN